MEGVFNYYYVSTSMGQLNIEDIGNCAIEANDDMGASYYLVIKTNLGVTRLFQYGPIKPDVNILCKTTTCVFKRFDYSESKLMKAIENFLKPSFSNITQAREISCEEALDNCIDIIEYMRLEDAY